MKKKIVLLGCIILLALAGCGSTAANVGLGTGIGAALSNTITGAKKDLEKREEQLVQLYNQGVEIGMEQESLDVIAQKIEDTRLTKETVGTGEGLLNVDWSDPKQTGGAIGMITMTVLAWMNRRKLKSTAADLRAKDAAIQKFEGTSEPAIASRLHEMVKEKTGRV